MVISFNDDEENTYKGILEIINNCKSFELNNAFRGTKIIIGLLEIDFVQRRVSVNNVEVNLTNTEFEILSLLANNPGRVFNKEQIYNIIWKEPYFGDYNVVMSHIFHIRKKIEDSPSKPVYIQTVWGVGYRFNNKLKRVEKSD